MIGSLLAWVESRTNKMREKLAIGSTMHRVREHDPIKLLAETFGLPTAFYSETFKTDFKP